MVDDLSTEDQIERLKEEARSCTYPTDAATVKKRYKDTALILFKEDLDNGTLRNYLTFGSRRSSSVSQYGNTPIVIRRSRSSNGELATVVEQVPTLQGRSTRSNYTLLESVVKEKDTDSEDETYFQDSRFDSDESFAVRGNHDHSRLTADSSDSVLKDQEIPAESSDVQLPVLPDERTSTNSEDQTQYHDAEENCNHHHHHHHHDHHHHDNTPPQQTTVSVDSKTTQPHTYDNQMTFGGSKEATSEQPLETAITDEAQQTDTDWKGDNSPSQASDHHISPLPAQKDDNIHPQQTSEGKKTGQAFHQNTRELSPVLSRSIEDKICSPEIDHEAILREYVQQPSHRGKSLLLHDGEKSHHSTSKAEKQEEEFDKNKRPVELRIVESSVSVSEQAFPAANELDPQKSLTASDIPHLSDDSDVVFIDAGSPSLSRTKLTSDSLSDSNEEAPQSQKPAAGDTASAPDVPAESLPTTHTTESDAECGKVETDREAAATERRDSSTNTSKDLPSATPQTPVADAESKRLETSKEDVIPRRRHNSSNSFRDLPIRSPTPPRRKPQKSQTPKLREKRRQRHSSLGLTSDEEIQEFTNGTRSASPTKPGDFRFFSISLKKEKSKSATSLGSKRNKERVKLTSVRLSLEDPGAVNPKPVPRQVEEAHMDTPGKRVGVRSMMIDGTIKRNFIVIHPSDDSDTIGLAPKSPQTAQREVAASTPEALSTVKTRIGAPSKEKLEVTKRISHQGGLKEELSDIPENIKNESRASLRSSLNFSQISRSLRLKQSKKSWEHSSLRSSQSLSSEPVCPSPSSSQILCKSPSALSRVDCDSPTPLPQVPNHTLGSSTVSRFCVVM